MKTKFCRKCGKFRHWSEFCKSFKALSGYSSRCKYCAKDYANKNKEKIRESGLKYRKENKDELNLKKRIYVKENREKVRDSDKKCYEKRRIKVLSRMRANYLENKIEIQRSRKLKYDTPEGKALVIATACRRRRLKDASKQDELLIKEWLEKIYVKKTFTCYYCRKRHDIKMIHIDHYNPLSKGGKHAIENLVTACASCNLSKSARDPVLFQNERIGQMILGVT